jgi:AraC-like DNA-binding protein
MNAHLPAAAEDTLTIGMLNLMLWAAAQHGADRLALCQRIGVDPAQLADPDARVPIRVVQQLWREAVQATGDEYLDLHLGEELNFPAIGILAYVMMHSRTLGAATEQLCRYQDIVCSGVRLRVQREADEVALQLELTSPDIIYPKRVINAELSAYLTGFRLLTAQAVAPRAVHFAYPAPANPAEHARIFAPATLHFGAARSMLVFEAPTFELPVLNANPALFPLFEQHAAAIMDRLRQPSLPARVKSEILRLLKGAEPTLAAVADGLAMGVRTLQLHLKEARLSYQQLLDEVRQELAERHLRDPYLSTADIAFLLGYSEPSVFVRSFKRWTGQTPGAFRRQLT